MDRQMIEQLADRVPREAVVREVSVYSHWVTAQSSRHGLCCYIPAMPGIDLPPAPKAGAANLEGWPLVDAVRHCLGQDDVLSRCVGLALANSALPDVPDMFEGEAQQFFSEKVQGARVCCIGHFDQARQWRDAGQDVTIIELNPRPGDVHWTQAEGYLRTCDIVFITGVTLINDTFNVVLDQTPRARERVLFGPSVPFCDLWFDYGITTVGSTRIIRPERAAEYFANGGTSISRMEKGVLMKINMIRGQQCG